MLSGLAKKSLAGTFRNQPGEQRAVNLSPAKVATKVATFFTPQRKATPRRPWHYRPSSAEVTTMALQFTLLVIVVAALWQCFRFLMEQYSTVWTKQLENFYTIGQRRGGLLRLETWFRPKMLSMAIRCQLEPKFQWALGAMVGFVFSPFVRAFGWTGIVGCSTVYAFANRQKTTSIWTAQQEFPYRMDMYIPPHVQTELLFGSIIGIITGI